MRTTRTTLAWLGLTAAALAAAAAWPEPASPATATHGAAVPAAAETVADTAAAAAETAAATPQISFPDGSSRPVLNGVEEPVVLSWPGDTPYAPVVATVHDNGVEWFQHADGSWSTTIRRFDSARGQYVTVCPLYQPAQSKPVQLRGQ